jgi:hypothetical protein
MENLVLNQLIAGPALRALARASGPINAFPIMTTGLGSFDLRNSSHHLFDSGG